MKGGGVGPFHSQELVKAIGFLSHLSIGYPSAAVGKC